MRTLKVFIVDDAENIRSSLKRMLSGLKHLSIIGEAESVKSSEEFLKKNSPDVTLLDLNLADGSGFEILNFIKSSNNPHIVIILSNYSAEQYKIKAREYGADYFFDKSTEFENILDVMNRL